LAVNALPMPILDLSPKDPVISKNPPSYGFTLSQKIEPRNAVRCFANNGLKAATKRLGKNRIEIRLNGPFSKGRGRINCTMAGNENRWRWLGRLLGGNHRRRCNGNAVFGLRRRATLNLGWIGKVEPTVPARKQKLSAIVGIEPSLQLWEVDLYDLTGRFVL